MSVMDDDLDLEILSYREFRNRQTLKAWRQRRRIYECQQLTERRREGIDDRASENEVHRPSLAGRQDQHPQF
jgi:hypothetical protein